MATTDKEQRAYFTTYSEAAWDRYVAASNAWIDEAIAQELCVECGGPASTKLIICTECASR